jgi:hypothetical protein
VVDLVDTFEVQALKPNTTTAKIKIDFFIMFVFCFFIY